MIKALHIDPSGNGADRRFRRPVVIDEVGMGVYVMILADIGRDDLSPPSTTKRSGLKRRSDVKRAVLTIIWNNDGVSFIYVMPFFCIYSPS
ncbi:hypothetical protein KQR56_20280 [Bacillus velezensis]|nr:hypothetical protein [Bacillus velezensis]